MGRPVAQKEALSLIASDIFGGRSNTVATVMASSPRPSGTVCHSLRRHAFSTCSIVRRYPMTKEIKNVQALDIAKPFMLNGSKIPESR